MGGSSASCAMQATLGLHIASSPSLLGCKNAQTLRSYLTRGRYPSSARTGVLSCHRHHSIPRARGGLSGPPHMQSILSVLCCPPSFWARVAVAAGKGGCRNFSRVPGTRTLNPASAPAAGCTCSVGVRREGAIAVPPGCGFAPLAPWELGVGVCPDSVVGRSCPGTSGSASLQTASCDLAT